MIVAFVLAAALNVAALSPEELLEEQSVNYTGGEYQDEVFKYRLLKPEKIEPGKKYPLVLYLHGAGMRGDDNRTQLSYEPALMISPEAREKYPCFLIAPQCRQDKRWVEVDWDAKESSPMKEPSDQMKVVIQILDKVIKENPVDLDRVYLTGLSMGGYGTWDLAMRMPERFAAVAPVCGGGDEQSARKLVGVPLWAFHGDKDEAVPVERSRKMIAAIEKAGGHPKYSELKGVGHGSWVAAYEDSSSVIPWMFAQRRDRKSTETGAMPAEKVYEEQSVQYTGGEYKNEEFKYRLLKPEKIESGKKYPLVLFLHGAGERGTDNVKQLLYFPTLIAKPEMREKYPCFVIAPQCRPDKRWVEVDWGAKESTPISEPTDQMKVVLQILDKVMKENPIDFDRVYLTGLSMGGYATWDLAMRMPERFAAVAPICGGGDEQAASKLAAVPVWAFHGDDDKGVPVERTRRMIAAIEKAGGHPKYSELKGVGHNSWTPAYEDPKGLIPWMYEQHRGK